MPFCTQCGSQVSNTDTYCPQCGGPQPAVPPRVNRQTNFTDGIDGRTWSTLCYVPTLGWLASVFVLASARFQGNRQARFHAFQGLYLFVAVLILDWGVGPFFGMSGHFPFNFAKLLRLALFGIGIFMMVKTYTGQHLRLPVFGELADRSLADHR